MAPSAADRLSPADQVRREIDLYNARDLDGVVAMKSEGFVHDMRATAVPGMEVYRGRDEYRRFLDEWLDAFPDSRLEIESIETAGEIILVVVHQEMSGGGGGVPVTFRYASVASYRNGESTATEFHTDLDRARERFNEVTASQRGAP